MVRSNEQIVDDLLEEIDSNESVAPTPHTVSDVEAAVPLQALREEFTYILMSDKVAEFTKKLRDGSFNANVILTVPYIWHLYDQCMSKDTDEYIFVSILYDRHGRTRSQTVSCKPTHSHGGNRTDAKNHNVNKSDMLGIGLLFKSVLGHIYKNPYKTGKSYNSYVKYVEVETSSCCATPTLEKKIVSEMDRFESPVDHLYLWAILFNKYSLAKEILLEHMDGTSDQLVAAIVGAVLLRGFSKQLNERQWEDISESYRQHSEYLEHIACSILEQCWKNDKKKTSDLLIRVNHSWGGVTLLSMAHYGRMEKFLGTKACSIKLHKIWRGDIALSSHGFWVILSALLPPMAFTLRFVNRHLKRRNEKGALYRTDEMPDEVGDGSGIAELNLSRKPKKKIYSYSVIHGDRLISYPMAVFKAMQAPMVKCVHYMLFYFSYLALYSLFLMTELHPIETALNQTVLNQTTEADHQKCSISPCCFGLIPGIGCLEMATYICVLSNLLDEIRQIFRETRKMAHMLKSFKMWFLNDNWNKVDSLAYIIFAIAVSGRYLIPGDYFEIVYWLFSFSLLVHFVRFSQLFYAVEELGPKIIMIKKMMIDLAFFLLILFMTILAFGVTTQAILNPQSPLDRQLPYKIFFGPYFQMYGELFLEDYSQSNGHRWILLAVYMILTNVLLLNLLIAMFSHTFQQVQDRANVLYKYNYYEVVYEHFDRPRPILLGPFYKIFNNCIRNCLQGGKETFFRRDFRKTSKGVESEGKSEDIELTKFVKNCTAAYRDVERSRPS